MTESAEAESSGEPESDLSAIVMVGVPLGFVTDPETRERRGLIRFADEFLLVEVDPYKAWFGATLPMPWAALSDAASRRGVADPEGAIHEGLRQGVLREIDFRSGAPYDWSELRLQPIGVGRGPDAEGWWHIDVPSIYDLSRVDQVLVDQFHYFLWAASNGRPLPDVVSAVCRDLRLSESHVWMIVPAAVHKLVSKRAANLDRVP